jgi:hypothetical protein
MRATTIALGLAIAMGLALGADDRPIVAERVRQLTRDAAWTRVADVPIQFRTYHPQGMVKVGDEFYISSVEVRVPTKRYPAPIDGHDRDTGEGIGHLFKMDRRGRLIADLRLGAGSVYHPGGIDFDGKDIWVPVSEYRPDSRSIIYKVSPATGTATEVFAYPDHIGAIVHNTDDGTLHGASWGSRRFYRWLLDAGGHVTNAGVPPGSLRTMNPAHYVDYQDCKYAGARQMLCTGVAELRQTPSAPAFRLGGLELVSLVDGRPIHQVPVLLWTASGLDMTHNPAWIEPSVAGLRAYFLPEDDRSTLYVYDVSAK